MINRNYEVGISTSSVLGNNSSSALQNKIPADVDKGLFSTSKSNLDFFDNYSIDTFEISSKGDEVQNNNGYISDKSESSSNQSTVNKSFSNGGTSTL